MRNVCGTQNDVTSFSIDGLVPDGESSSAFIDREDFVIRVNVQGRSLPDHVSHITDQSNVGMQGLSFKQTAEFLPRILPFTSGHFCGLYFRSNWHGKRSCRQ